MTLSISGLQINTGQYNVYSVGFRNLIENHLIYLQNNVSTINYALDPQDEYVCIGDFYKLLNLLNINQDLFYIVLRMNNLHSPIDYSGNLGILLIPSRNLIFNSLLNRYLNSVTLL